jgi:Uma2 family endonuclease
MFIGGVFGNRDTAPYELIAGYVVRKMPENPAHVSATNAMLARLTAVLPIGWTCRKEGPVRIPAYDEAEPDVAVVRGAPADYRLRHPGAADVGLLVEVSDATLRIDQTTKLGAYAREKVPVYCIVDLVSRRVEIQLPSSGFRR